MNQYKYTRKEVDDFIANGSKAKKFTGVVRKGNDLFLDGKKIIPVDEHRAFLSEYYDNPETWARP